MSSKPADQVKKDKPKVTIRNWTLADIPALLMVQKDVYPDYTAEDGHYESRHLELQLNAFPEGQFLAMIDGVIVGYATSLIIQLDNLPDDYRYNEITGSGTFATHTPTADTLYGADIGVLPKYRGAGVSKKLYSARRKLMLRHNLRRMVAYGRIPGYKDHAGTHTPKEYVAAVKAGRLKDSSLNAHLSAGYDVVRLLMDYVIDNSSLNICTVLEMTNDKFKPERRKVTYGGGPVGTSRKVRVCTAQYLLRDIKSWEEFERTTEFFVQTADAYHGHFLLLPEMFTSQLLNLLPPELTDLEEIRALAGYTDQYIALFKSLAVRYGLFVIAGSHPVIRDDQVFNVAHMFTPTGHVYTQDKLHPTPGERSSWNMRPGQGLTVFDTPHARIAIQVCYDVEFPEPSRLLTLAGAEILFVPYSTDDRKGHNRVSFCARARAIENAMYVVTSGNAGTIKNTGYLLNYAESAVYTPSDYGFPPNGEAGKADPNIETVVVADLDLSTLVNNRESGSTRPLYDRRTDVYELKARTPVRVIRVE